MPSRSVEAEVKLEAGVGFVVPALRDLPGGVVAAPLGEARLTATYVDTADLRLMRSGVTLRHRHELASGGPAVSEWTLKLPLAPGGAVPARRELRWPGPVEAMPAEPDALVRAWRRSSPLGVVARLVTVRQRTALRGPSGAILAELDDDVVSVMDGPRLAARFREIEVELAGAGGAELVADLVGRLERAGARRGDDRPKVVRALGAPASAAPDVEPVRVARQATVRDVARGALADGYLRLVRHHAALHLDEDVEDVHRARVATRRLRSDLRFLRRELDGPWVRATRAELGWLAAALGAVRDADVLAERLRRNGAALPEEDSPAVAALLAVAGAERAGAMRALEDVLASGRYVALLDRLAAAIDDPPMAARPAPATGGDPPGELPDGLAGNVADGLPDGLAGNVADGDRRARAALPAAVARPMHHLDAAVAALGDSPSDEALHRVRIAAKRLRYACETAVPVCGREARALGRAAADVQAVLGDLHDAAVVAAWLRRAGMSAGRPVALAAGELIAREHAEAAALRTSWRRAWKRLARRKLRRWLDG